jgi:hypothetical protein
VLEPDPGSADRQIGAHETPYASCGHSYCSPSPSGTAPRCSGRGTRTWRGRAVARGLGVRLSADFRVMDEIWRGRLGRRWRGSGGAGGRSETRRAPAAGAGGAGARRVRRGARAQAAWDAATATGNACAGRRAGGQRSAGRRGGDRARSGMGGAEMAGYAWSRYWLRKTTRAPRMLACDSAVGPGATRPTPIGRPKRAGGRAAGRGGAYPPAAAASSYFSHELTRISRILGYGACGDVFVKRVNRGAWEFDD